MRQGIGATPLVLLWALPLLAGLGWALTPIADGAAWIALFAHPQLWSGLALSILTGTLATLGAMLCTLIIAAGFYRSRAWHRLQRFAAVGLALPHLAFAIGFALLIMPGGLLARLFVGGESPPHWVTTQDPWGLSLAAALMLKEIPFLLSLVWSGLSRGDLADNIGGRWQAARSLGHGPGSIWLRVVQPQLLRRLVWPILIVWFYGASVVDMALVLGPTQPPTLAVVIWKDLNDAEVANNLRGTVGSIFLMAVLAVIVTAAALGVRMTGKLRRAVYATGPSGWSAPVVTARVVASLVATAYIATLALLVVISFSGRWPYPLLWPEHFSGIGWSALSADAAPLLLSLGLALASAAAALAIMILWLETQGRRRDTWLLSLSLAALALPQVLVAAGQYRLFLQVGLTGTGSGLFLAHLTPVLAYVAVVLVGPYRDFDQRYAAVARSLRAGPVRIWWQVKLPLLRGPLAMAAAVGFAVSMVQFVPAQLIAAGRFATLPMEAVTLSSGGNRSLTAAYALALALPPMIAFAAAGFAGKTRWR